LDLSAFPPSRVLGLDFGELNCYILGLGKWGQLIGKSSGNT